MNAEKKLNERQELFCQYYVITNKIGGRYNATQAAKDAGYSEKTAYSQGHDLLKHPEVSKRIHELERVELDKLNITREKIIREKQLLAFSNISDYRGFINGNDDEMAACDMRAVQEVSIRSGKVNERKVKLYNKQYALESLERSLGFDQGVQKDVDIEINFGDQPQSEYG